MTDLTEPIEGATPEPTSTEPASPPLPERYGADAGPLAGMTKDDAIAYVGNLQAESSTMYQNFNQLAQSVQAAAQPAPVVPQIDAALIDSDPAEFTRQMRQENAANISQVANQFAGRIMPQMSRVAQVTAQNHYKSPKIWEKYGAEIEAQMSQIDSQYHTEQAWTSAADLVAGRHFEEIAQERAQEIAASNPGVIRGSSGAAAPMSDGREALWAKVEADPQGARMLATVGREGFAEFARETNQTLEKYVEMVTGGPSPTMGGPGDYTTVQVG